MMQNHLNTIDVARQKIPLDGAVTRLRRETRMVEETRMREHGDEMMVKI